MTIGGTGCIKIDKVIYYATHDNFHRENLGIDFGNLFNEHCTHPNWLITIPNFLLHCV